MRTGIANLPLHAGQAPRWLFERMVSLSREITCYIVEEFGTREMLERLADPVWFQSLGCVLGFDWHSSGLTTTTTGALKEALKEMGPEMGLFIAGGKGRASRRTPEEIARFGESYSLRRPAESLIYASRMSAKVDNTAVQDGFQLYHHCFVFTQQGEWAVIQQGMNEATGRARRYHWLFTLHSPARPERLVLSKAEGSQRGDGAWRPETDFDFVNEPHSGVITEEKAREVLNLVAKESDRCRKVCASLAGEPPKSISAELRKMKELSLPAVHRFSIADLLPGSVERVLLKTHENPPADFERLLATPGAGPKTIRALALIAEVLYGTPASRRDPARYSFAHGGKDGVPYPVDRQTYDRSIAILREAVGRARIGDTERKRALERLARRGTR